MGVWKLGIGVVVLVALAAATIGFVGAQTDEDGDGPLGNFVGRLAENLGITQDELDAAIDETQLELVDEALAEGRLTEEQAADARERIESGEPFFGALLRNKQGMHQGGMHEGGMHEGGMSHGADIAEFIGVTPEELRAAIEGGQSLVQVAEANGVSEQALTDYLLGETEAKLAEAVESGKIDQATADEKLAGAAEKIAETINREGLPEKPEGFGGFERFREGGRFPGGFGRFHGGTGNFPHGETPDVTEAVSPTF